MGGASVWNNSNGYKIVHMNKARLVWLSLLPHTSIEMTDAADDWLNDILASDDRDDFGIPICFAFTPK